MRNIKSLYNIELRRSKSTARIIFIAIFFVIVLGLTVAAIFGLRTASEEIPIPIPDYVNVLYYYYNMIVPVLTLIFGTGIISFDKNNHWLRTIMSRPVSLQEYITSKILAVSSIIFVLMLILGALPAAFVGFFSNIEIGFHFGDFILLHVTFWLQSLTYLALMAWLSMWIPGYLNLIVFGAWFVADFLLNSAVIPLITELGELYKWKITWLIVTSDFLFPSGFSDALKKMTSSEASFPTEELMWGFAALSAFFALSYWHITKISLIKND